MPKVKLTDPFCSKVKAPPRPRQEDYWDTLLPAFGLRVSYNGTKSWLVMTRVLENGAWKQTRVTLGRYPLITLAQARDRARQAQADAQAGRDPRGVLAGVKSQLEEESRNTFASIRTRYVEQHCKVKLKTKTAAEYQRVLESEVFQAWERRPIVSLTRKEVIALVDSINDAGKPIMANQTLSYLRAMMNWTASKGIIEFVPTDHVKPPAQEVKRDRYLTRDEIAFAWPIFESFGLFGQLYQLLLLTGQRLSEVAGMKRSELDLLSKEPLWTIPRERTKGDREHLVPLSPLAVRIIKSIPNLGEPVFTTNGRVSISGFSKCKTRADEEIAQAKAKQRRKGIFEKGWTQHDLRRTAATIMAELGVSRDVVELILNHASGTRGGVAGVYNRSELLAERRRALNLLADHVDALARKNDPA